MIIPAVLVTCLCTSFAIPAGTFLMTPILRLTTPLAYANDFALNLCRTVGFLFRYCNLFSSRKTVHLRFSKSLSDAIMVIASMCTIIRHVLKLSKSSGINDLPKFCRLIRGASVMSVDSNLKAFMSAILSTIASCWWH